MVVELEADDGARVEVRHKLSASLDSFFNLDIVRQQKRLEGAEVVRLQRSPHPDLLDKDECRLSVELFGGAHLLARHRRDARGEQSKNEDWLHGWEFNPNARNCILSFLEVSK